MCLSIIPLTSCGNSNEADLVVFNNIYTAEKENNGLAEAFAVKDGKYIYVGTKEGAKAYIKEGKTQVIDGNNEGLVVPGATEGHAHYFGGVGVNSELPGSNKSYEEVLDILANKYKSEGIKQFVSFGWPTVSLTKRRSEGYNFAKEIESKAPGIPVVLIDNAGHAAVCNETALKMAGLSKENPTVRGGEVFIASDGELSGYVGDQAVYYMVDKVIKNPLTLEQYKNACEYGMKELLKFGFTNACDALTNMYDPTGLYEALKVLDEEHKLKMVVAECFHLKSFESNDYKAKIDQISEINKKYKSAHCDPSYIKIFSDGVVESGTGWIFGTYNTSESGKEHGNIIWEKPELNAVATYANSKGLKIHAHTFGDAACDAVIDSYLTSNKINGGEYRNCLAHVRNIRDEEIIKASENKIAVAANLIWHTDFGPDDQETKNYIINNIGEEMYYNGYPIKSLMDKGVIVSSSTDAPAAVTIDGNILNIVEISVTGVQPGYDEPAFNPKENVTIRDALDALTINGAWQLGLENERGSIKVGKYADFVIIDKNILSYQGEQLKEIHNAKILNTYFEGEKVYSAD